MCSCCVNVYLIDLCCCALFHVSECWSYCLMLKNDAHMLHFCCCYQQVCHLPYHLNFSSDHPALFISFRLYVIESYVLHDFHNCVNILALVQFVGDCAIYIHLIILTTLGCLSVHRMYAFNFIACCHLTDLQ